MPTKSIIVACAQNNIIGYQGTLPWRLPRDLQHFRQTTWNKTVIMGRRTFESLPKPLANRNVIVLTHQKGYKANHATICHSWEAAWSHITQEEEEVFVAGGAQLYKEALRWADKIYLTAIEATLVGDTYFPAFKRKDFKVLSEKHYPTDAKNKYACTFWELVRVRHASKQVIGTKEEYR